MPKDDDCSDPPFRADYRFTIKGFECEEIDDDWHWKSHCRDNTDVIENLLFGIVETHGVTHYLTESLMMQSTYENRVLAHV